MHEAEVGALVDDFPEPARLRSPQPGDRLPRGRTSQAPGIEIVLEEVPIDRPQIVIECAERFHLPRDLLALEQQFGTGGLQIALPGEQRLPVKGSPHDRAQLGELGITQVGSLRAQHPECLQHIRIKARRPGPEALVGLQRADRLGHPLQPLESILVACNAPAHFFRPTRLEPGFERPGRVEACRRREADAAQQLLCLAHRWRRRG